MLREYWRDPRFWAWWWRERIPSDAKLVAAVIAIGMLGIGGFAAAGGLDGAVTTSSSEPLSDQVTTVERLVTLRESGEVVTKPVRVVRTIAGRGNTVHETQVLQEIVTRPGSIRSVPVARRYVVTRDGRIETVVRPGTTQTRTSVVTDRRTVTDERVLTSERVVTDERVVTSERVVTRERVVTDTVPVTVRSTETIERTETVPVTVVETVAITVVETAPPVTVTVTVKKGD